MSGKVNEALAEQMGEARRLDPQREIPVVVTIKPGTDPAILTQRGLKIEHTFEDIHAVSGTLVADEVDALAQLSEVESIEFDGTAWAV